MPIYEYRRPDGSTFEVLQAFTDKPLERDPDTGVPVERVLHAPAVHFKGKGFYNTDYGTRKRQREKSAAGDAASSSDGASSANGSSSEASTSGGASASGGEAKESAKPTAKSESATTSSAS
jgi:putative FmdB family regulatory protein